MFIVFITMDTLSHTHTHTHTHSERERGGERERELTQFIYTTKL